MTFKIFEHEYSAMFQIEDHEKKSIKYSFFGMIYKIKSRFDYWKVG